MVTRLNRSVLCTSVVKKVAGPAGPLVSIRPALKLFWQVFFGENHEEPVSDRQKKSQTP